MDKYVIIDREFIEKRIQELEKGNEGLWWKERDTLKQILSQSTPLIPEIEKSFLAGHDSARLKSSEKGNGTFRFDREEYISNLKF